MYTSANKNWQTAAMKKVTLNSNKSLNNFQPITANSKIKDTENKKKFPALPNNRNASKLQFAILRTSKSSKQVPSAGPLRCNKVGSIAKREIRKPDDVRKSNIPLAPANKTMHVNKIVLTENSSSKKKILKRRNKSPANDEINADLPPNNPRPSCETGVQTIENEILNHHLVVGDFKIITPSKSVIEEIDKSLKAKLKEKTVIPKRKFEEHSQKEEQHLDDLNEFLDKNFITRKLPKLCDNIIDEDRKLIESMDELLQCEKPKTESITDIKSRIKRKERELLSLFDHFQKKQELLAK